MMGVRGSSTDKSVMVFPLQTEDPVQTMNCHDSMVWSIHFDKKGEKLVSTGDDGSVQLYLRQESVWSVCCHHFLMGNLCCPEASCFTEDTGPVRTIR